MSSRTSAAPPAGAAPAPPAAPHGRRRGRVSALGWARAALALAAVAPSAVAFDSSVTFAKRTYVLSAEGSYGEQFNFEGFHDWSEIEYWNLGARVSILPFGPTGPSVLRGAFEVGLEPLYQNYTAPRRAFCAGLVAVSPYHFLSLRRLVPYADARVGAGGTDLKVREIDSNFSFLLWAGLGASGFPRAPPAGHPG